MKLRQLSLVLALIQGFFLGIHNGHVALWEEGGNQPLQVFPYRAEVLPPADQAALEKGIPIESKAELISLLEDYLS
jgi:hypothetical protein